jgi:predicted permease
MHSLLSDLRYATRELRKRPGFTLTAVLSLGLGIGATSAVFSVIYAVLIDPFPYPGADRLMELVVRDPAGRDRFPGLNGVQIEQLRQAKCVESITAGDWWNLTTTDSELPEDVQAVYLSPNAPSHLGTRALMGRWMIPSDAPPGQEPQPVVVLGYEFWQRYFGANPGVIGRTLQLVHKNYEVIGVMPPRFKWGQGDIYLPLRLTRDPNIYRAATIKLRPGVSVAQANDEFQPLLEQFAKDAPSHFPEKFRVNLRSITDVYAKPLGPMLFLLLGAVASLLLIGCANVSILLLARGTQRQHELAVRAAVGASRTRIVRQLLAESLALAVVGTGLGILLASQTLSMIAARLPENSFPAESVIEINVPVLAFSAALAFATAIVFGLWPALQLSRPDIGRLMQSSARRVLDGLHGKRTHGAMVGAQVALTLLLLTAAGAAGKGFLRLVNTQLGYDPHNTMSVPIPIHENTHVSWKDRSAYFEEIRTRIAAMPEVIEAGISTNATPPSNGSTTRIEILANTSAQRPEARVNFVNREYFSVLRIPLAQGRIWDRAETARGAAVAVVNQTWHGSTGPAATRSGGRSGFPTSRTSPPTHPPRLGATAGCRSWVWSPTRATTGCATR